jgi:hypothetical protein
VCLFCFSFYIFCYYFFFTIQFLQREYKTSWVCGVVWCGVVWCGVVCGVVWCGWCVVWCGVVCGVVWCVVWWSKFTKEYIKTKSKLKFCNFVNQLALQNAQNIQWRGGKRKKEGGKRKKEGRKTFKGGSLLWMH